MKKIRGAGTISLLALNAGMGRRSGWDDAAAFREVMDVNFFGVINGIAALLPMVKRATGPSAVVITGSKQGITNPPGSPAVRVFFFSLYFFVLRFFFCFSTLTPTLD